MKPKSAILITAGLFIGFSANAFACGAGDPSCIPDTEITRNFISYDGSNYGNSADLRDLPHGSYFTWGIQWNLPTNETITGASLTFKSIYDDSTDLSTLYTNLLNLTATQYNNLNNLYPGTGYSSRLGVGTDVDGGGDQFASNGYTLEDLTDIEKKGDGSYGNRVITFTAADLDVLRSFVADGVFGLGIDPDCHFNNSGVVLSITTLCKAPGDEPAPVPEPATMLLLGTGLIGLAGVRARRRKE